MINRIQNTLVDSAFELKFNYENKPEFHIPVDDVDFVKDNENFCEPGVTTCLTQRPLTFLTVHFIWLC